jgi:hypothetical protein
MPLEPRCAIALTKLAATHSQSEEVMEILEPIETQDPCFFVKPTLEDCPNSPTGALIRIHCD